MSNPGNSNRPEDLYGKFRAFKERDTRAFEFFYDRFHPDLYKHIFSLVKLRPVAEEIVQDAFVILSRHMDVINSPDHIKAYLFRVAYNLAMTHLRKDKVQRTLDKDLIRWLSGEYTSQEELDAMKDRVVERMYHEINNLPFARKQIFLLFYLGNMDVKAIADQLGLSVHTVRNQKERAMKQLKKVIPPMILLFFIAMFGDN